MTAEVLSKTPPAYRRGYPELTLTEVLDELEMGVGDIPEAAPVEDYPPEKAQNDLYSKGAKTRDRVSTQTVKAVDEHGTDRVAKLASIGEQRWVRRQGPEWTGGRKITGNRQNDAERKYPRAKLTLQPDSHTGKNGSVDSRSKKMDNGDPIEKGAIRSRHRGVVELVEGLAASRVRRSDRPARAEEAVRAGKADAAPVSPLRTRRVIPV